MLKKSITYTDFEGNEVTEDFYFHLSKADLVEMEVSYKGGLSAWLKEIAKSDDAKSLVAEFKKLILMSYGVKSPDGKRFVKTQDLRDSFMATEAYSSLFIELCTDAQAAAAFVNGIIPQNLDRDMEKIRAKQQAHPSDPAAQPQSPNLAAESDPTALEPDSEAHTARNVFETGGQGKQESRVLTMQEVAEMDSDELKSGIATGRYKLQ